VSRKAVHFHPQLDFEIGHSGSIRPSTSTPDSDLCSPPPPSSCYRNGNPPPPGLGLATTVCPRGTTVPSPPDASPLPSLPPQGGLIKTPGLSEVRMTVYHPHAPRAPRAPLSVLPPNVLQALLFERA
jgi:hypothetical protein